MGFQVVIPLAGLGTRLRPHTYVSPKPLLWVAGKPILEHIVDKLEGVPVDEVLFITGHLGEQIERWADERCPYKTRFVEQRELRGQAHAISLVRAFLHAPTLIVFGDTIFDVDLTSLTHSEGDGVLFVQEVADPRRFGVAVVEDDIVTRLVEKPSTPVSKLAVVGIYFVRDPGALMRGIDTVIERDQQIGGEFYLADALQAMIEQGARFGVAPTRVWADCGTIDALLSTNAFLLGHGHDRTPRVDSSSTLVQPVNIHPTARILGSTVGPNASIGRDVSIQGSTVEDAVIGEGAEIVDSTLRHSLVGARSVVTGFNGEANLADDSQVRGG